MKHSVLMVGPSTRTKGGIASVIAEYERAGLGQRVNLRVISSFGGGSSVSKILAFISGLILFLFSLPGERYSIVHLHTSHGASFKRKSVFFKLAKLFKKKTLFHIHGSDFSGYLREHPAERVVLAQADCVLVLYDALRQDKDFAGSLKNIRVLYNPVHLDTQAASRQPKNHVQFSFLGRLGERKGVYELIECIQRGKEVFMRTGARFVLAGDGEIDKVKSMVKDKGLESMVEVPGWVDTDKKEFILSSTDVLVLPSRNEQMPMSVLEGMARGCPIIATRIAGIPEMVADGENGYLYEPGDKDALTKSLLELSENTVMRKKMGERSFEIARTKFESQKVLSDLVGIYGSL